MTDFRVSSTELYFLFIIKINNIKQTIHEIVLSKKNNNIKNITK